MRLPFCQAANSLSPLIPQPTICIDNTRNSSTSQRIRSSCTKLSNNGHQCTNHATNYCCKAKSFMHNYNYFYHHKFIDNFKLLTRYKHRAKRKVNCNYFYKKTSKFKSIFLLFISNIIAIQLILLNNFGNCLKFPLLTDYSKGSARQAANQFTFSHLCPGKMQFPITKRIEGALITSEADTDLNCTVTFRTKLSHQHFVVRFEEINLGCDDHLRLFDGDLDYGQQSISDFSCRDSLATTPAIRTTGSFLTLHYTSEGESSPTEGFKLIITATFDSSLWECPADYAICRNNLCIARSLFCDDINHCLDNSDESNCNKTTSFAGDLSSLGIIIIVLVLIVFIIVVIVMLFIYCRQDDDHFSEYRNQLQMPMPGSSSVMFNQYQYLTPPNISPYMNVPQARMGHGYSTLPINLTRQVSVNKNLLQQSPINGPYVMMPAQPMPMMITNANDLSKFSRNNKQQQPQSQPYNMVLMGSNSNSIQQPCMFDSQL